MSHLIVMDSLRTPSSQSTKQPSWRYVCHELNESYRNVTNLMSHAIVMNSLRTLSFILEYTAAIVEVCVSRTQRFIEMSRT